MFYSILFSGTTWRQSVVGALGETQFCFFYCYLNEKMALDIWGERILLQNQNQKPRTNPTQQNTWGQLSDTDLWEGSSIC